MGNRPYFRSALLRFKGFARWLIATVRTRRSVLWSLLAIALLPAAIRALLLMENGSRVYLFDLIGFLCDLALGMLAAAALLSLHRFGMLFFLVAAAAWLVLNFAYYEFVRQYGSPYLMIHAGYLFDRDFLVGSAVRFTHPYLMALGWVWLSLFGLLARRGLRLGTRPQLGLFLSFALLAALPLPDNAPPWRQRDFVSNNAADLIARAIWSDELEEDFEEAGVLLESYLKPDLTGQSFLAAAKPLPNVILVVIEGITGANLPLLADAHGLQPDLPMPRLDALARRNLSYSTFLTHQKQSNRGLYATLCGDLPRLTAGLPKMTLIANGAEKSCLPRRLLEAGYDTLFLNSAHNDFMYMGAFMRKIGFRRALGEEDFGSEYWRGTWGVDDKSLYRIALDHIETLRARSSPHFVTLYTSTTHHPFVTPDSPSRDAEGRAHAWGFADDAIADFVAELERRGQLDDTLVLITSDEASSSGDPHRHKHGTLAGYTENWGFMVAIAPERFRARVDSAYQQADIALSVMDYLGLDSGRAFLGRSIFRSYDEPRSIFTANVYKGLVHEYLEGESLTICSEGLHDCERFLTGGAPIFAFHHEQVGGKVSPSPLMRAVRAYSVVGRNPSALAQMPEEAKHHQLTSQALPGRAEPVAAESRSGAEASSECTVSRQCLWPWPNSPFWAPGSGNSVSLAPISPHSAVPDRPMWADLVVVHCDDCGEPDRPEHCSVFHSLPPSCANYVLP